MPQEGDRAARPRLTNPDKPLFEAGPSGASPVTKAQLATYFETVAPAMLPDLARRPLSVVRCPRGPSDDCFFQKHPESLGFPEVFRTIEVTDRTGPATYFALDGLEGLLALVQLDVVEIHAWNSHAESPETPDRIIFDLDPGPGTAWDDVVVTAHAVQRELHALGLGAFPKTTGGRGLHVVSPIMPKQTHAEVRAFAHALTSKLAERQPERYTVRMAKTERPGRVFIDYLRNSHGATAIAAYSPRARPGAPVSVPVTWQELDAGLDPHAFDMVSVPVRLARAHHRDPWPDYERTRVALSPQHFAAVGAELLEGADDPGDGR
jgi:bifunctional non-homologous end joining protein LigD